MTPDDHDRIHRIDQEIPNNDRGKIIQVLLAMALVKMKMGKVANQICEGVDLTITQCVDQLTYTLEVKTSTQEHFTIAPDEYRHLCELAKHPQNRVYVAALRIKNYEDWLFIPMKFILPGKNSFQKLTPLADRKVAPHVSRYFAQLLREHTPNLIRENREALHYILAEFKRLTEH